MKLIGVTGGMGSGKTTVCKIFSKLGANVFSSDNEAKKLQEQDSHVIAQIKDHFGTDIYQGKNLDRKKLGQIVFSNREQLQALNQIIHPVIKRLFNQKKIESKKENRPALIKEAAIIYESGTDKELDAIVVVTSPLEEKLKRLAKKGIKREDAIRRMKNQLSDEEKIQRADFIIRNNGSINDLEKKVKALWKKFVN